MKGVKRLVGKAEIETELVEEINRVLKQFPIYCEDDTLIKSRVIEDFRSYKETVMDALIQNEKVKATYCRQVGDTFLFKLDEFIQMLRYKNYWDSSYTAYKNEVGL